MKLIIAILRDSDNEPVSQGLIGEGFRVTRIASTGGFLRRGSSTLVVGVEDAEVEHAVDTIRNHLGPVTEPGINRANLFVLNIEHFHQI